MTVEDEGLTMADIQMTQPDAPLPVGYSSVQAGHLAAVVTNLEMLARPENRAADPFPPGVELVPLGRPDIEAYRMLFRLVGEDWLWFSRLIMPDAKLAEILNDPKIDIFVLRDGSRDVGILELDYRTGGECEIAFLGLAAGAVGKGLGRKLMAAAIDMAWSKPIQRLWLHTCTYDHPSALAFYQRAGFVPFSREVEITPDPRISGVIPRERARHVPIVEG